MEPKKVLVVDDEETSREIALFDIRDIHDCDSAVDAFDAYDKIWNALIKEKAPYDVIVLDEIMPGMDGIALIKIMNTNRKYIDALKNKPMKLVIMSDVEAEKYVQKIYRAVLDEKCAFIRKPIRKGQLSEIINDLFAG